MNFDEWVKTVPLMITGDPLWKVEAYRPGLFAAHYDGVATTNSRYNSGGGLDVRS